MNEVERNMGMGANMEAVITEGRIVENRLLAAETFLMTIDCPEAARRAGPGRFVKLRQAEAWERARNGLAVQVKIVLGRVHDAYYVASDLDPPPDGTSARVVWVHAGRTRERRVTGLKRVGPYLVVPAHIGIKPGDSVGLVPDDGGGQP